MLKSLRAKAPKTQIINLCLNEMITKKTKTTFIYLFVYIYIYDEFKKIKIKQKTT